MLVKVAVRSGAVCKRKASLSSSALSDWESAECQGEEVRFSPRAFGTQRQIRTKLLHCFAFVGFGAASMRARLVRSASNSRTIVLQWAAVTLAGPQYRSGSKCFLSAANLWLSVET